MNETLKQRLADNLNVLPTVADYTELLKHFSQTIGSPLDKARKLIGGKTYKEINKLLNPKH